MERRNTIELIIDLRREKTGHLAALRRASTGIGKGIKKGSWGRFRTVDEDADGGDVDEDQHGHAGLALTLGALGSGVVDELLIGAEKVTEHGHCRAAGCARVGVIPTAAPECSFTFCSSTCFQRNIPL